MGGAVNTVMVTIDNVCMFGNKACAGQGDGSYAATHPGGNFLDCRVWIVGFLVRGSLIDMNSSVRLSCSCCCLSRRLQVGAQNLFKMGTGFA